MSTSTSGQADPDDESILFGLDSKVTSEVQFLGGRPGSQLLGTGRLSDGVEYSVDHDRLAPPAVHRSSSSPTTRQRTPAAGGTGRRGRPRDWREVIPHRPGIRLDAIDPFADHLRRLQQETARPASGRRRGQRTSRSASRNRLHGLGGSRRGTSRTTSATSTPRWSPTLGVRLRRIDGFSHVAEAPTRPRSVRPGPAPDRTATGHGDNGTAVPCRSCTGPMQCRDDSDGLEAPAALLSPVRYGPTKRR